MNPNALYIEAAVIGTLLTMIGGGYAFFKWVMKLGAWVQQITLTNTTISAMGAKFDRLSDETSKNTAAVHEQTQLYRDLEHRVSNLERTRRSA